GMPAVIVGNVSLQANLDHDHDELCCKAFEEILESCLPCVQSAFAEFARLGVGEVHKVGVSNGQYAGRVPKVKTLPKFAFGHIDCIQLEHSFSLCSFEMSLSSQAQF